MSKKKKPAIDPYKIVWRDGEPIDARTDSAVAWVEKKSGLNMPIVQGSYKSRYGGGADASKGTHDGGGIIDVSIAGMSARDRVNLMHWAKRAGFFGWFRHGPGWEGNEHLHLGLRKHRNLAPLAAAQEIAYDNRRNGLVSNLRDNTWRPLIPRRWSHRRNRPVLFGR